MNKLILTGNLTRDPELTETPSGVPVCRFSIAVNRPYANESGERETDFFNCTAWRGLAENIAKFCEKGKKLLVVGSLQQRTYEDNQGIKRTVYDVIVQDCEFLSRRSAENGEAEETPERTRKTPTNGNNSAKKPVLQSFDDDGDIPF